jgi:hypothetical protein
VGGNQIHTFTSSGAWTMVAFTASTAKYNNLLLMGV